MKYGRVFHIRGSCSTGHVANQHCLCSLTTAASVVEVQPCFDELFHLLEWTILDSYNVHLTWCMVYGTVFVAATTLQPDLWGRKDPADTAKHAAILHRPGPARYLRQIEWTRMACLLRFFHQSFIEITEKSLASWMSIWIYQLQGWQDFTLFDLSSNIAPWRVSPATRCLALNHARNHGISGVDTLW